MKCFPSKWELKCIFQNSDKLPNSREFKIMYKSVLSLSILPDRCEVCKISVNSRGIGSPCTPSIHTVYSHRSFTLSIHTYTVHLHYLHRQFTLFTLSIHTIYTVHSHHLFTPSIHIVHSHRLFTPSIHIVHSHRLFTSSIHTVRSYRLIIPSIHIAHSHSLFTLSTHTVHSYHRTVWELNFSKTLNRNKSSNGVSAMNKTSLYKKAATF